MRRARGMIARRARRNRYCKVIIPAIVAIQAVWRGAIARAAMVRRRARWLAAVKLQMERHKSQAATVLQCAWRQHCARFELRLLREDATWRRVLAARVIVRAWRAYLLSKSAQEIAADLQACADDTALQHKIIRKTRRRMCDIAQYVREAEHRLEELEGLIEGATFEDAEQGWAENYDKEYDAITNSIKMTQEEQRLLRVVERQRLENLMDLHAEAEDLHCDLDANAVHQMDLADILRRLELARAIDAARRDKQERTRRERARWKLPDARLARSRARSRNRAFVPAPAPFSVEGAAAALQALSRTLGMAAPPPLPPFAAGGEGSSNGHAGAAAASSDAAAAAAVAAAAAAAASSDGVTASVLRPEHVTLSPARGTRRLLRAAESKEQSSVALSQERDSDDFSRHQQSSLERGLGSNSRNTRYNMDYHHARGSEPLRAVFDAAAAATADVLRANTFNLRSGAGAGDFREGGHVCDSCGRPMFHVRACECGWVAKNSKLKKRPQQQQQQLSPQRALPS
ncbi:hypothetical protein JKP88DRAFT_316672 [Tribonema minus]|uniref:Uncharacterized protein n=1 Tax=Tribonema minus TaxID=303371 RepID=A0A836CFR1_9STRA|nr:hypothetical protein JKP88DRAFT_316672 [Tribonema minus]